MVDTPTRVTNSSKFPINHAIHQEKLSNLNSQFEIVDITNHCCVHVLFPFSLDKPNKKTETFFRFPTNPPKTLKFWHALNKIGYLSSRVIIVIMLTMISIKK